MPSPIRSVSAQAAVLVFLGDGDDEAQVALDQLLHRVLVAARGPAWRWRSPAALVSSGVCADFVQVLVENVAVGVVDAEGLGRLPLATACAGLVGAAGLRQDLGGGQVVGDCGIRGGVERRAAEPAALERPPAPSGLSSSLMSHDILIRSEDALDAPATPASVPVLLAAPVRGRDNIVGGVAQLGERVNGIHEVRGSIPLASTRRSSGGGKRACTRSRCARTGAALESSAFAGIAQLVEHNLAKVGVAGSSPVSRSRGGRPRVQATSVDRAAIESVPEYGIAELEVTSRGGAVW